MLMATMSLILVVGNSIKTIRPRRVSNSTLQLQEHAPMETNASLSTRSSQSIPSSPSSNLPSQPSTFHSTLMIPCSPLKDFNHSPWHQRLHLTLHLLLPSTQLRAALDCFLSRTCLKPHTWELELLLRCLQHGNLLIWQLPPNSEVLTRRTLSHTSQMLMNL
jgi:hypothetical protein